MYVLVVLVIGHLGFPDDLHGHNVDSLYTIVSNVYAYINKDVFSNLYCDGIKVTVYFILYVHPAITMSIPRVLAENPDPGRAATHCSSFPFIE